MKKYVISSFVIFVFIVLSFILSPQTVSTTKITIDIILNVILPTLFPLMLLTLLFIEFGGVEIFAFLFQKVAGKLFGISGEGFCSFLSGLLGGSPLGAMVLYDLMDKKMISLKEGQKLFNIAAYISPGFILVTLSTLNNTPMLAITYYLTIVLILILSGFFYQDEVSYFDLEALKAKLKQRYKNLQVAPMIILIIKKASISLLIISGTMVLFNLPYVFFNQFLDNKLAIFLSGLFEFSKGSILLISNKDLLSYLGVIIILSWGGIAMVFQNASYAYHNIKIKPYVITRVCSIILNLILFYLFYSF